MKTVFSQSVLVGYSLHDAGLLVVITLCAWYVINVINNVSWIYAFLIICAWSSHTFFFASRLKRVVFGYLIINFGMTFIFLWENFFISKRYLIGLSLVLLLWIPAILDEWVLNIFVRQFYVRRYQILLGLSVTGIFISSLGSFIHFGYSKTYLRDAASWISQHVAKNEKLYVNDETVMYYSQHFGDAQFILAEQYRDLKIIKNNQWQPFDYLALRLNARESIETLDLLKKITFVPIKFFQNKRGDRVIIYAKHKTVSM